ncbi:MAG TPA: LytTR family DNA-binding domain-containing protein [Vicinamibacteria bacterium]|nr:LytTR family DNA-binding domain-containing protein [Vicinamibacteria bacterium]
MLRVVIVDDEELSRRGIRARLQASKDVEVVAECGSARRAVGVIRRTRPDLVFLDVQMPGMDGFGVLDAIGGPSSPRVIFVTAHDQHAIRAFEVNALDYLLKPIDDERFDLAVERARQSILAGRDVDLGRRLAAAVREAATADEASPPQRSAQRFAVRQAGRVLLVKTADIDWVEAAGDYVTLHVGKRSWLLRETMAAMDAKLPPEKFARIHRSAIVNVERIAELWPQDNGEYVVRLADGAELRLSRSYRQALQRVLGGAV